MSLVQLSMDYILIVDFFWNAYSLTCEHFMVVFRKHIAKCHWKYIFIGKTNSACLSLSLDLCFVEMICLILLCKIQGHIILLIWIVLVHLTCLRNYSMIIYFNFTCDTTIPIFLLSLLIHLRYPKEPYD